MCDHRHVKPPTPPAPPRLYSDLADWFHLLTAPEEYAEEAAVYRGVLEEESAIPVRTVLELGSGGGNNAFHLKDTLELALVDLSPQMLEISRRLNPECQHLQGDMRTVRLGRSFDAVFVHDAVQYLVTLEDLRATIATAFLHCREGGVALFVPDFVRETFHPSTGHGGHDGEDRALRYLEWVHDPDPGDSTYVVDFAYLLIRGGEVRVEQDRHVEGLFSRQEWLDALAAAGFVAAVRSARLEEGESLEMFVGRRGAGRPE